MRLDEDMHVHSTFSDGTGTLSDNVRMAEIVGLTRLGLVDHVRADTQWVPYFARAVDALKKRTRLQLKSGLEAKLLDAHGKLDIPRSVGGVDHIYVADHQFPLERGSTHPKEVLRGIRDGALDADECIEWLVRSLCGAMERHRGVVIAHLFSVLPKSGLSESQVSDEQLRRLAHCAAATGSKVEFDERWRCPSARALRAFVERGVEVYCSSDAHMPSRIGRYRYALDVAPQVAA